MALDISGPLAQKPRVDGRITIVGMDISVPSRFNSVASPLPGTKHLNPTATARARLALVAKAKGSGARAPLFDATLAADDLRNEPHFRPRPRHLRRIGRELACERLRPRPAGDRGLRSFARLAHASEFAPDLHPRKRPVPWRRDARSRSRRRDEHDAASPPESAVTGPAVQPAFQISSNPSLPEDEILSRILFQKSSGSLSAFQALRIGERGRDPVRPSRRVRECAKIAWRRQPGHQHERHRAALWSAQPARSTTG